MIRVQSQVVRFFGGRANIALVFCFLYDDVGTGWRNYKLDVLCDRTGLNRDTLLNLIKELQDKEFIYVTRAIRNDIQRINISLNVEKCREVFQTKKATLYDDSYIEINKTIAKMNQMQLKVDGVSDSVFLSGGRILLELKLLIENYGEQAVLNAWAAYLRDKDNWYLGHPVLKFVRDFSKFYTLGNRVNGRKRQEEKHDEAIEKHIRRVYDSK